MFLSLLKLLGIDVHAKIAEFQADLETKAYQAEDHLIEVGRRLALMTGLLVAGVLMGLTALLVGLAALFEWLRMYEGPIISLGIVAGILVVMWSILISLGVSTRTQRFS